MKTATHYYLLELQERASAELLIFKIVHAMRPGHQFRPSEYRRAYKHKMRTVAARRLRIVH